LLDCGASENFIGINTWKTLKIGRFKFEKQIPVQNIDRTTNNQGSITYYCWLKVRVGEQEERTRFYLTGLGKERFILGYPFFWDRKWIGGRDDY